MKTAKDLIIPFCWENRKPVLLERFLYVPNKYPYEKKNLPFFEKNQPIVIEYCSGNGQWIAEKAKQFPNLNWIAVEKKFERARKIWMKSVNENLPNLFVACSEGLVFTRFYAPHAQEIFVNFPDPWPKFRHSKHRLIRKEFIDELCNILNANGKATCVTDDSKYAEQIEKEFGNCTGWKLLFHVNQWPDYGKSFFNDLWIGKGRVINYLSFERI